MDQQNKFVNLSEYGILGINYYWTKKDRFHLSEAELIGAGILDGNAYVDKALIKPLQAANKKFKEQGFELIVKDAFRTPELYRLVQEKRYKLLGKEETDKLLNMKTMPHTTGRTIDVNLIDLQNGKEVVMRNPSDGSDAFFIDFYKDKSDPIYQEYQRLQMLMIDVMLSVGFQLGVKREFWHFEYPE